MVKVKVNEDEFYIDGYLKSNLDILKKQLKKDYDCFIIVSGRERFGKSTLASQIAYYLDPTYTVDRCVFTSEQFKEVVEKTEGYKAVVFDEAHGYLNSRQSMSTFNRSLIKIMAEMGSRNLIVVIVLPSFFELDKYPAIHRSTCLLNVHERGKFSFYNFDKKLQLYIKGKRFYAFCVKANFFGSFTKFFSIDEEAYKKKKYESLTQEEPVGRWEKRAMEHRVILINLLKEKVNMTQREISRILHVTEQKVALWLRKKP